jgi:hypothetical protein
MAALRTVPTWSIALGKAHTWPDAWRADSWAQSVKTAWKRSWPSTKNGTRVATGPYSPECVEGSFPKFACTAFSEVRSPLSDTGVGPLGDWRLPR